MLKNKKGFVPIVAGAGAIAVVGAFILLIVIGILVFTSINKYAVIGGGAIALVLIFGLRGEMNKTKAWFMGVVIIGGLVFLFASGSLQSVFGQEDVVYTVDSGRYECSENSVETSIIKYADQNYEFTCGDKELVDDCRVYATCMQGTPFYNSQCGGGGLWNLLPGVSVSGISEGTANKLISTLKPGESIKFTDEINNADYLKLEFQYNPYQLWTIEKGKKVPTNSNDCSLVNQNKLTKQNIPYGEWDSLYKGEVRNYFLNWERSYGLKIYSYNGQSVLCGTNTLYELDTERLADGTTRNIQGNFVKYVDCCPHQDDNCGSDFEFLPSGQEEEKECSYDYQCSNSGDPQFISSSKAKKEVCKNNICVEETFSIQCNSDAVCIQNYGDNYVCSKALSTFGKCIEGKIAQPYCGDGTCGIGETFTNCPKDCEEDDLVCDKWYQEKVPAGTTEDCGALGWKKAVPLVDCETTTFEATCKTSTGVYILAGIIAITILGVVFIVVSKRKPKRRKRR